MLCLFLLHTALYPHVVGCIMLYNTISLIISLLWLVHTHIGSSGKGVTRYNPNSCWSIMLVPIKGTCIGSILHFQTNPHVTSNWLDMYIYIYIYIIHNIHAHHIMSPFVPLICPNPVFCAPADLPKKSSVDARAQWVRFSAKSGQYLGHGWWFYPNSSKSFDHFGIETHGDDWGSPILRSP